MPNTTSEEIRALIRVSQIYMDDGALMTAAERLRKAADLLEKLHDAKMADLRSPR